MSGTELHVFSLDDSAWPIVKARWSGTLTDDHLSQALDAIDAWLARGERFGLLIDARGGRGLTSEQRKRALTHMKATAALSSRYLEQALVIDNAVLRTLDNAVGWMLPRPFVSRSFADSEEASSWLRAQLASPV